MDAVYVESQTFDSLRLTKKQFDQKYKFDLNADAHKLDPQTVEDIRDQEDVQVSQHGTFYALVVVILAVWVLKCGAVRFPSPNMHKTPKCAAHLSLSWLVETVCSPLKQHRQALGSWSCAYGLQL